MKKENDVKRPVVIWILSIFALLSFLLNVPLSVIGQSVYGSFYAAFILLVSVVNFFSFVGVFMMKRWGVQLFAWMFIVGQAIMIIKQWWTPLNFVISFVLIVILALYYKRMD